ncbi:MAG: family 16 glycoside hydrolase [Planctomycetota bacterium]|jgi:HEAT repeat protein/type 1 glutamine amidotransferase
MKRFITLLLVFGMACISLSGEVFGADEHWQNLFDGKTLKGWVQRNGKAKYEVEDGMIVGTTVLNTPNSFLCTEKMYTDFILELEFLVESDMNSGIQIRSNSFKHYRDYRVHGYQVEIDPGTGPYKKSPKNLLADGQTAPETAPRSWSGGIYDEARRGWLNNLTRKPAARAAFKQNQWNHYRIEAVGGRIGTWINGVPAADLKDDMTSTGFIALQVHGSKHTGKKIKWRNIRIQDLTGKEKKEPLKALIVDGQNNHNWKGTTPVLKSLLEETGLFAVDVATSPAKKQPMDSFKPNFAKYNVIVANYTGDEWPKETQDALVEYMENGGGLVVFHAADNAFPKWKEWNEMIAVGGWGGRNEKSGPKVRYRDGKVVLDHSPGRGGSHGPQHEFQIVTRDRHHGITAGLPEKWMHAKDELYSELRGPAKNMKILATAYADPAKKGTGEHEPILFTVRYGKGRVFHTALGHGPEQLRCIGFIVTFQRGAEWAAMGRVTQKDVPDDFPTADKVSLHTGLSADYDAIESYDFGKSRRGLAAIEEEIRNVPPSSFPHVEEKLLKALESPKTTFAGKQFVCRMLRRVGSAKSVPALSQLLGDKKLSHMARFALQHMPAPQAGAALHAALSKVKGDLQIGVIGSIGQRGDLQAVPALTKLATGSNTRIARTAIDALGRIGGPQAADVLAEIKVPAGLKAARDNAYLMCADSMLAEGQKSEAVAIYGEMASPANSTWIRIATYRGFVQAGKDQAVPVVMALLKDKDLDLQRAAGKFMTEIPGTAVTKALAMEIGNLGTNAQIVLLSALEARGDKTAAPYVAEAVIRGNVSVRPAAVKALAVLGDASNVELLATASAADDETGKAAMDSLSRLSGPGVADVLAAVAARSSTEAPVRVNVIETLVSRGDTEALPVLFDVAKDDNKDIRQVAYKALGALSGQDELAKMTSMLLTVESGMDRSGIERAMIATVTRLEKPDVSDVIFGLGKAGDAVKPHLLAILSRVGGKEALDAARGQLLAGNADVRKAAIRALADWPGAEPLADLMKIAKTSKDSTEHVLALRGYIKLLGMPANRSAAETVELLSGAMDAAQRADEKKAVLAALPKYPCEQAVEIAERSKKDSALSAEAELASKKIKEALLSKSLKATASRNSNAAHQALDGNQASRWDTGRGMKPGDWFVLDLGIESTVKGLTLDTRNSSNDYPRGYEIYVSFDGGSWGKSVVTGKGTEPITKIKFDKPVKTRFIKILQTGSSDSWNWSIHELTVDL